MISLLFMQDILAKYEELRDKLNNLDAAAITNLSLVEPLLFPAYKVRNIMQLV